MSGHIQTEIITRAFSIVEKFRKKVHRGFLSGRGWGGQLVAFDLLSSSSEAPPLPNPLISGVGVHPVQFPALQERRGGYGVLQHVKDVPEGGREREGGGEESRPVEKTCGPLM